MATEKLNISGWDNGWPSGFAANVDESISNADGQTVGTSIQNDVAVFDLANVSSIVDADTITDVGITVRARHGGGLSMVPSFDVELLIGGVSQGSVAGTTLTTSFTNRVYSLAGWDSDWTQAQLNGAQVRVTYIWGGAGDPEDVFDSYIDCIDVDITYTAASKIRYPVVADPLALTGKVPFPARGGNSQSRYPEERAVVLSGKVPVIDTGINAPVGVLVAQGKVSWLNSLQLQLQVSGWNSGWPTGFASNIDDTTANPDGQTISTTLISDNVTLYLDDVTGTIIDTDEVLSVTGVLRASAAGFTDGSPDPGSLLVQLVIDSNVFSSTTVQLTDALQNYNIFPATTATEGLTVAQLNSMYVLATATNGAENNVWAIDAIDITVEYVHQTPLREDPVVADPLVLSGFAPTLFRQHYRAPAVVARALTGKVPTLFRQDTYYPDERFLILAKYAPTVRQNYLPLPLLGGLTLTEKANAFTVNYVISPAAETLALAGKVPVPAWDANHQRYPARVELRLFPENPVLYNSSSPTFDPPRVQRALVGKVPVLTPSLSVWRTPAIDDLALSGKAPAAVQTSLRKPAVVARNLVGKVPVASRGSQLPVAIGAWTFAGKVPLLRFSNLPIAEPAPYRLRLAGFTGLQLLSYTPVATITANHQRAPATATLTLTPENPVRYVTNAAVFDPPRVQRTLAGQAPVEVHTLSAIPAAVALALSSTTPTLLSNIVMPVGAAALSLVGENLNFEAVDSRVISRGTLTLVTTAPSLDITSGLTGTGGQPGLISLSIDYDIEFIATPTDILID